MTENIAIVWFREDLRLHDNPALAHALEHHDQVVPLYLHTPAEAGTWQAGAASQWWLHHSLSRLHESLLEKGSRLVVRQGDSALELLQAVISQSGARAVYWNRLYTPWATQRDRGIKSRLRDSGIAVKSFRAGLLFEPDEIHKDDGGPYRVFTAFWKRCLKEGIERQELSQPDSMPPLVDDMVGESLQSLRLLPELDWDRGFYPLWQPGEQGALEAMDRFMQSNILRYADERDYPSRPVTSRFSPHLHFGELSAASVVNQAILIREDAASENDRRAIDKLIAEVGWREFAAYTLYHAPQTTDQSMDRRFHDFPWQADEEALQRWQQGQTGLPIIDAGMRELWHTGWMHNRVRMLVASFLTKNLMIHWLQGARWFWDTLVDADLASNSLGWQWVAGCGTDAAPYFRIFNPVLQSQKFDADGEYIRRWVPEISELDNKAIHEPWKAGLELDYPDPMIDLKFSRERALQTFQSIKEKPRR